MKNLTLLLALLGFFNNASSQNTLIWSEDFEVSLPSYIYNQPSINISSDTIKVVGVKNTNNGQRLVIVNYDLNGDTISSIIFGNDSVGNNTLIDYKFDATNHVYLAHRELISSLKTKIVLQKYSLDGSLLWVEQIQSFADTSYSPHSIGLANDTSFFLSVNKAINSNTTILPFLYLFNSSGNQLWSRSFNTTEVGSLGYKIFTHNNSAYIFSDINWLTKVDINNNLTTNHNTGLQNGVSYVQITPDNNLLITAWTNYRISKSDLDGNLIWTEPYGTNLPPNVGGDEIKSTIQDSAGNIFLTGRHYGLGFGTTNSTSADILTLKYDSSGNFIWENRYEYENNNADIGNFITLKNGNVYVGGQSQRLGVGTDYDYIVLKTNESNGNLTGEYRYNGLSDGNDIVSSLHVFNNDSIVLTGLSFVNAEYAITTQLLSDVILSIQQINLNNGLVVYPNPIESGQSLTIDGNGIQEYSLFTLTGQVVQSGKLTQTKLNTIKINQVDSGVYILKLESEEKRILKKLIVN